MGETTGRRTTNRPGSSDLLGARACPVYTRSIYTLPIDFNRADGANRLISFRVYGPHFRMNKPELLITRTYIHAYTTGTVFLITVGLVPGCSFNYRFRPCRLAAKYAVESGEIMSRFVTEIRLEFSGRPSDAAVPVDESERTNDGAPEFRCENRLLREQLGRKYCSENCIRRARTCGCNTTIILLSTRSTHRPCAIRKTRPRPRQTQYRRSPPLCPSPITDDMCPLYGGFNSRTGPASCRPEMVVILSING